MRCVEIFKMNLHYQYNILSRSGVHNAYNIINTECLMRRHYDFTRSNIDAKSDVSFSDTPYNIDDYCTVTVTGYCNNTCRMYRHVYHFIYVFTTFILVCGCIINYNN